MDKTYEICTRCIMDNVSSPKITFNKEGVCCYCQQYDEKVKLYGYKGKETDEKLSKLVEKIKKDGEGKKYDCVLGISGGVDSAYMAYIATKLGLRILAVHVDAGWNTEIAVENIKKVCDKLNLELHTITVDWVAMKELQRAYMFSGLPNIDVPQDHAFIAAVFQFAKKNGVKYMLNGSNFATEGILPPNFGHAAIDYKHMKSIYKACGRGEKIFDKYPHFSLIQYWRLQKNIERVNLLNYVPYSKKMAMEILEKEFDWKYYGGKHYESIFTKWEQAYYLPQKFGFDKKRAHLSSLVVGGEMTREEALNEINDNSLYPLEKMQEDGNYIRERLEISDEEWEKIMKMPNVLDETYKGSGELIGKLVGVKRLLFKRKKK